MCVSLSAGFSSDACPEGFVCIVKNTLRILTVENVGETFNQAACRLRYTPRKLLIHPDTKYLIIGEVSGCFPIGTVFCTTTFFMPVGFD